jgi:hypothetical protein
MTVKRRTTAALLLAAAMGVLAMPLLVSAPALAQQAKTPAAAPVTPPPAATPPAPTPPAKTLNPAPSAATTPAAPDKPGAPTTAAAPDTPPPPKSILDLSALLTDDGPAIKSGLVWRIFSDAEDNTAIDPKMKLVATSAGGDVEFKLDPGTYIVHAAYGRAGATTKIELTGPKRAETLVLNAGGVKLNALLSGDIAIPEKKLTFDVYAKDSDSGGDKQALVLGAAANKVIRLNADTYQIVSHYGNANAVVRAEVHVTPGKLTEATLYQKAAEVTLKLVTESGGEALTNVDWLILTPSGDQVSESEGTFATIVLAEGDYSVVARRKDQVYTRNFSVESGYDREVEITATKPVEPPPTQTPAK